MIDKQAIRDFLVSLTHKDVPFGDQDSLLVSKLLDSLKIAELVVFLESHFNVTLDGDDLTPENLDSIDAIVGFLEHKIGS
jgi:acyl carrier protein